MGALFTAIGIVIAMVVVYFLYQYFQSNLEKRHAKEDVPRIRTVNDTNYNIDNTGIDDRHDDMSTQEAAQAKENWDKTDYIPSDEEFYDVKKKLDNPTD